MADPNKLSKRQLNYLEKDGHLWWRDEYTEQQLREAVEMQTQEDPVSWEEVCDYIFHWFNKFTVEFKREARQNFIKEVMDNEHLGEKEATRKVDEAIADTIANTICISLANYSTENFITLQQIKEGKFYEFINIDHLLYKE